MRRELYYFKIQSYKKRRAEYRMKYTGELPIYKTERYLHLTKRISQWQKEIKRLDVRKEKINKILQSVNRYFNVKIESRSRNPLTDLARKVYFKIGLEQHICGTHLGRFIGRKHENVASYNRKTLTQSFKTKPENREAFYNFKQYISCQPQPHQLN